MKRATRVAAGLLVALAAPLLCSCTSDLPAATGDATMPSGPLTVLAAASLTEAFTTLGRQFEGAHPGTTVTFSFGSSSTLATQAVQGAPADVFAAASTATMATVTEAGAADAPADLATNVLEIAVPPANPGRVKGLTDLARTELDIALCAPQVPCGAAAEQVLRAAGVAAAPDTLESDVKAVLQKVVAGDVDVASSTPPTSGPPGPTCGACQSRRPRRRPTTTRSPSCGPAATRSPPRPLSATCSPTRAARCCGTPASAPRDRLPREHQAVDARGQVPWALALPAAVALLFLSDRWSGWCCGLPGTRPAPCCAAGERCRPFDSPSSRPALPPSWRCSWGCRWPGCLPAPACTAPPCSAPW